MIGCGAAKVSAPPASGRPSETSCAPSVVRKWSGPGTVLASSISQARAEGSRMRGIMQLPPDTVIAVLSQISCIGA